MQQGSTPHPLSGSKNKSNAFIAPQNIVSLLNDVCYCVFHCCRALELVYNEIQTQWERKEFAHELCTWNTLLALVTWAKASVVPAKEKKDLSFGSYGS